MKCGAERDPGLRTGIPGACTTPSTTAVQPAVTASGPTRTTRE